MRLYKVEKTTLALGPTPADNMVVDAFIPTNETYVGTEAFKAHAKKNGEQYEGCRWILLAEAGESNIITIERDTTFIVKETKAEAA
jgi:hypothetical protein